MLENNPWIRRYDHIDRKYIAENIQQFPAELGDLEEFSPATASEKLEEAFNQLFVPTEQILDIVEYFVDIARGFALVNYQDPKKYIQNCYDQEFKFGEKFPILLTSFAGEGKSSLLRSLVRVFPRETSITLEGHPDMPLVSLVSYRLPGSIGIGDILKDLLGEDIDKLGKGGKSLYEIIKKLIWKYHRCGGPFFTFDETQFIARSENSNVQAAILFGWISVIGLPHVIALNFSLGHRLLKRPQEDVQRFLSQPKILLPDRPDSDDWKNTLLGYKNILKEAFTFDPERDAESLFGLTLGNKRILGRLLKRSYELARRRNSDVSMELIDEVNKSKSFASDRNDVREMAKVILLGQTHRKDLVCPFEYDKEPLSLLKEAVIKQSKEEIFESIQLATLTPSQISELAEIKKQRKDVIKKPIGTENNNNEDKIDKLRRGEEALSSNC
jgi:hypothetical protein